MAAIHDRPVLIAGGGIGGLAGALALLQAGFDVHVYEQSSALREVGAGIQVSPNAARILHRYGLSDELARVGVRPIAWHQRRWDDGRTLLRTPLGEDVIGAFGFPHHQCHRADVLAMLTAPFRSSVCIAAIASPDLAIAALPSTSNSTTASACALTC